MARFVYMAKLPSAGLGIDFGVNGYFGGVRAKTNKYVSESNGIVDSISVGDYLKKQWFGGEVRIYSDILGGTSIKAEYIAGTNSSASTTALKTDPNKIRKFSGYYIYLVKNIGNKNQLVARYDFYDPNTKLSGDNAKSDFYYKSWNLAWQYYLNDNLRISLNYDMPVNEKDSAVKNANGVATSQLKDNTFTVRIQAKF